MSAASFWDSLEIVAPEGDAADDKKPVKVMTLKFEQRVATYRKAGLTYPKSLAKAANADPTGYSMWVEKGGDVNALAPTQSTPSAERFVECFLTAMIRDKLSRGKAIWAAIKAEPESYPIYEKERLAGRVEDIQTCAIPAL